nr:unnamed protein product [Hydra vulgaris]
MKVQIWMFVYLTWIIAENVLALDVSTSLTSSTPFSVSMVSINSSPSFNNVVGISYSLSQNYSAFNTHTVSVIQNISNFFKLKYRVNFTDVVAIFGGLSKTKNSFCKFWDTTASYYPYNQTTEYCTIHPGSLVVLVEVYGLPSILEMYKDYINESIVKGLLDILDSQNNSYSANKNSFRVYKSSVEIKQYRPPFTPPPPLVCTDNRSYIIIAVVVPIIVICISIIVVFIILSSYKKKNKVDQINLMAQNERTK